MKINNATDLYNFLKSSGLINITPESSAMYRCVEEYSRMCACDPASARNAKLAQCRTLYISFVQKASQFKDQLLSKTTDNVLTLGIDGQVITTLNR